MSLVGNLRDFHITDLLQMLASSESSGKLSVTRSDGQALMVFRRGRIIYTASTSMRETLGSILVSRRVIDEQDLSRALEVQHDASRELRLGNVLVEMGVMTDRALEEVVRWQITRVVVEVARWESGYFKFDSMVIPDCGEVEVDLADFIAREGLSADRLMLDLAEAEEEDGPDLPSGELPGLEHAASRPTQRAASLRTIMGELQPPELTGELVTHILAVAQETIRRGVLFTVRGDEYWRRADFGLAGDPSAQELVLSAGRPSVLSFAAERMEPYLGPLFPGRVNRRLAAALGGEDPSEVLVLPMPIARRVEAIFYGDNGPGGGPIGDSGPLEILILRATLAIEQTMLERRKAHLRRLMEERGEG